MDTSIKEKHTPTEILMNSLASCEGASGVIIIVDKEGDGIYTLRSNLSCSEVCGLFEIAKHHLISSLKD